MSFPQTAGHSKYPSKSSLQIFKSTPELNSRVKIRGSLSQIIDNCTEMQGELINTWRDGYQKLREGNDTWNKIQEDWKTKNGSWFNSPEYQKGKKKLEEKMRKDHEAKNRYYYGKIKSLLNQPVQKHSIKRLKNLPQNHEFRHNREYVASQDIVNIEVAKMLSFNKREFGGHYDHRNSKTSTASGDNVIKNKYLRLFTKREDIPDIVIKNLEESIERKETKRTSSLESEKIEKIDYKFPAEKSRNNFILSELQKLTPKRVSSKVRPKIELKIPVKDWNTVEDTTNKQPELVWPLTSRQKVSPHIRSISQMPGSLTSRKLSKESEEVLKIIENEFFDIRTRTVINKLVSKSQHKAFIHK